MADVEFDPEKNARNIRERGLSFDRVRVRDLDWTTSHIRLDERNDYGELRWIALGHLDGRLQVLVFTETARGIRVISLRRANTREVRAYGQTRAAD